MDLSTFGPMLDLCILGLSGLCMLDLLAVCLPSFFGLYDYQHDVLMLASLCTILGRMLIIIYVCVFKLENGYGLLCCHA